MNQQRIAALSLLAMGLLLFSVGLFHQFLGLQALTLFVLVLVGSAVIAVPTRWSLRILFIYIGFEGFAKIVSGYHPAIHVGADLLVVALFSKTLLFAALGKIKQTEPLPPLTPLFIIHVIWFLITFLNPYSLGLIPSLAGAKVYITMLLLYFFGYYITKDKKEVKYIMIIWILVTTIHSLAGLYQASIGPQSVIAMHPGYAATLKKYGSYAFRPVGLTHLPGAPAIYIFLSTGFLLYFLVSVKNWLLKTFLALLVPLWIVVMSLCQVRSALLKMILSSVVFFAFYFFRNMTQRAPSSPRKIFVTAFLFVGIILAAPTILDNVESSFPDAKRAFDRSFSLFDFDRVKNARKNTGERILRYAQTVPFGAGLSRTGAASGKFKSLINSPDDPFGDYFFADNFWIATIVDIGIPGSIILTIIIFFIIFKGLISLQKLWPFEDQLLHASILAGLIASAIGMYGAEAMLYNPEAAYFWFFSGALIRMHQKSNILKYEFTQKQKGQSQVANTFHNHL